MTLKDKIISTLLYSKKPKDRIVVENAEETNFWRDVSDYSVYIGLCLAVLGYTAGRFMELRGRGYATEQFKAFMKDYADLKRQEEEKKTSD